MGPRRVLPLRVSVDLGVLVKKGNSTLIPSTGTASSDAVYCHAFLEGYFLLQGIQSVYFKLYRPGEKGNGGKRMWEPNFLNWDSLENQNLDRTSEGIISLSGPVTRVIFCLNINFYRIFSMFWRFRLFEHLFILRLFFPGISKLSVSIDSLTRTHTIEYIIHIDFFWEWKTRENNLFSHLPRYINKPVFFGWKKDN